MNKKEQKESNKKNGKVTINDIAERVGVSKTTVSRYINGHYQLMSEDTRKRIEIAIEETNYRPNRIAQNLKAKNTKVIGCVVADITSQFSTHLVKGISDACEKIDYQVLIANIDNDPKKEKEALISFLDSQVDGLIVNSTGYNDDYILEIKENGIPIVLADRYYPKAETVDVITSKNYEGTIDMMEHLHTQGYDHIYFITQSSGDNMNRIIRHNAFMDATKKYYGRNGVDYTYSVEAQDEDALVTIMHEIKKKHTDENVALFAVNGMALLDIVEAIKATNYEIAKDFGLAGIDDWRWARLVEPEITTLRQDTYKTGLESVDRLMYLINVDKNAKPVLIELPTQLNARASTIINK